MPNKVEHKFDLFFSDFFQISEAKLNSYGAFNVSLLTDLPLFIDPFLLFNSHRRIYKKLHQRIIDYLKFLREKSVAGQVDEGLLQSWYFFPEVKENWLGFSADGNAGRGLGRDFALALNNSLQQLFADFGKEKITRGSHLEKLCLIKDGVGRDTISDFTTNLIKDYLLEYTQSFARKYLKQNQRKRFAVRRAVFDYRTETWITKHYSLPSHNRGFVLLTPKDLLTKDDTWINKQDLLNDYSDIPHAIPDDQLRSQINNYFLSLLPRNPVKEDENEAKRQVYLKYPQLIDYYIRFKEDNGKEAETRSEKHVSDSKHLYVDLFGRLAGLLDAHSDFYSTGTTAGEDVRNRLLFLKDVIENKGGHRLLYLRGKPVSNEEDLHILYRLTWFASRSTVTQEANDGRGPVDFKVSRSSNDIAIVEMKLASNTQLKRNLQKQTEIYQRASDARTVYKVILYYSLAEEKRVEKILKELKLAGDNRIILIDARKDNKPSGSKA